MLFLVSGFNLLSVIYHSEIGLWLLYLLICRFFSSFITLWFFQNDSIRLFLFLCLAKEHLVHRIVQKLAPFFIEIEILFNPFRFHLLPFLDLTEILFAQNGDMDVERTEQKVDNHEWNHRFVPHHEDLNH